MFANIATIVGLVIVAMFANTPPFRAIKKLPPAGVEPGASWINQTI